VPSSDALKLANGTATVSAQVTDPYGNQSALASQSVTVAETLPTVTINKINGNDVINNAGACSDNAQQCQWGWQWTCGEGGDSDTGHASALTLTGSVSGVAPKSTFQVTVTDGSFSSSFTATVNAAGTSWTAMVPASDVAELPNGTATFSAQVTDQYGNTSTLATQLVTVEGTTPKVLEVSASPDAGDLDAGKTVVITLKMNEAVKVTGSPSLTLDDCGTATYNSSQSTDTSLVFDYIVAAGQNTSDLTVSSVNLPWGSSIADSQGDNADLSGALVQLGIQIDTTPPCVDKVASSLPFGDDIGTGAVLTATLDMSEPVTVSGTPELLLSNGGIAVYDSAKSSSTALAFKYVVGANQSTDDLRVAGVELPSGASVADLAGNNAEFSGAAANLSVGVNSRYSPTSAPAVGGIALTSGSSAELFGASSASVTFPSAGSADLTLDDSSQFTGQISDFAKQDQLDLADIGFGAHSSLAYHPGKSGGGTLVVSDGIHTANIALLGQYTASSFAAASDGHGGTLITDPPPAAQNPLTQPHSS
jgi:hypothetical protein